VRGSFDSTAEPTLRISIVCHPEGNCPLCWAKSSDFGHISTGLCPEQLMKKKNSFNPLAFLNTQTRKSFSAELARLHLFRAKSCGYVGTEVNMQFVFNLIYIDGFV
jgi:hypothetical protein